MLLAEGGGGLVGSFLKELVEIRGIGVAQVVGDLLDGRLVLDQQRHGLFEPFLDAVLGGGNAFALTEFLAKRFVGDAERGGDRFQFQFSGEIFAKQLTGSLDHARFFRIAFLGAIPLEAIDNKGNRFHENASQFAVRGIPKVAHEAGQSIGEEGIEPSIENGVVVLNDARSGEALKERSRQDDEELRMGEVLAAMNAVLASWISLNDETGSKRVALALVVFEMTFAFQDVGYRVVGLDGLILADLQFGQADVETRGDEFLSRCGLHEAVMHFAVQVG